MSVENFTQFFSEVSRCLVNKMSDFKAMQNGSNGHSGDAKTQTPRLQCCVTLYLKTCPLLLIKCKFWYMYFQFII